jgi:general secretion pathway protein C
MSGLAFIAVAVLAQVASAPASSGTHVSTREMARGIRCSVPGNCVVRRALVDRLLAYSDGRGMRIVPSLVDGKPAGFKIYSVRAGSWLDRLGVRNGDRFESVNGYDLTTPDQALLAYMALRNEARFVVRIVRRGEPQTLSFEIR